MSEQTRESIINCLVEFTGREERPIFRDESWITDFGLDSLGLFHFLLHLEKSLGFSFPEDDFNYAKIEKFGALVEMLDRQRSSSSSE